MTFLLFFLKSSSINLFGSSCHVTLFERFKIWNSNNYNLKQHFERVYDLNWKSYEYKSCTTHQDVLLLFWSSFHVMNFERFKIWIPENDNFKFDFQLLNDFSCKGNEYQCCITRQDPQLIFWSSFHLTKFDQFKFWISINVNFK